jgi:hypothetical protein
MERGGISVSSWMTHALVIEMKRNRNTDCQYDSRSREDSSVVSPALLVGVRGTSGD